MGGRRAAEGMVFGEPTTQGKGISDRKSQPTKCSKTNTPIEIYMLTEIKCPQKREESREIKAFPDHINMDCKHNLVEGGKSKQGGKREHPFCFFESRLTGYQRSLACAFRNKRGSI
jgi:hypothetical protein